MHACMHDTDLVALRVPASLPQTPGLDIHARSTTSAAPMAHLTAR